MAPGDMVRIESKLDDLHEVIHSLAVNYKLMQQEIQGLAKTLTKLEDIDKQFITCRGDCNGKADLLQKGIEENAKDINDLYGKIRFRDKVILGLFVTVFLRLFLFFLIGVK